MPLILKSAVFPLSHKAPVPSPPPSLSHLSLLLQSQLADYSAWLRRADSRIGIHAGYCASPQVSSPCHSLCLTSERFHLPASLKLLRFLVSSLKPPFQFGRLSRLGVPDIRHVFNPRLGAPRPPSVLLAAIFPVKLQIPPSLPPHTRPVGSIFLAYLSAVVPLFVSASGAVPSPRLTPPCRNILPACRFARASFLVHLIWPKPTGPGIYLESLEQRSPSACQQ